MTTTESWVISAPRTIEIDGLTAVSIQLNDGAIEIVGEPGRTQAVLEVSEISDRPLQVSRADGQVKIDYNFSGAQGLIDRVRVLADKKDRVVARLVLPATAEVRVTTARAGVTAKGLESGVNISTASGEVQLDGVHGPAQVKTASADIEVERHLGDLTATTGTGKIEATGKLGRVTAQTVSGDVELRAEGSTPNVQARTVSGDVSVRLDPGTPVNLRARGASGKVSLDDVVLGSGRAISVDHADDDVRAAAFVSASVGSGEVAVTR